MTLEIVHATYSTRRNGIDVKQQLTSMIKDGCLDVIANNAIAGDPQYGKVKKLRIRYIFGGQEREKVVPEGDRLKIGGLQKSEFVGVVSVPDEKGGWKEVGALPIPDPQKDSYVTLEEATEFAEISPIEPEPEPIKIKKERIPQEPPPTELPAITQIENPILTDIIIPTYNNEAFTVACFKSIKKYTKKGTYRVIWVDNGSKQKSKAKAALRGVNHIAIMLETNTGFVNAINTGLAKSDAPSVCLLNNDTEVSPRWLEKLTDRLYADPKLGIICPLTGPPAIKQRYDSHHNIAFQQRSRKVPIFPYYKNLIDFNERIEELFPRMIGNVSFCAFLCAVMKREVIEKVTAFHPSYANGLDTSFDMGMWDDCDYNWAIEKVGYKTAIALDTCIIHHGRTTFKEIQAKEGFNVDKLVSGNEKIMNRKRKKIEKELKRDKIK